MHYLRSVFTDKARAEGFLTYKVLNTYLPIEIKTSPLNSSAFIKAVDTIFFSINYPLRLYVTYDLQKAAKNYSFKKKDRVIRDLDIYGSIFKSDGYFDQNGNLSDYKKLLIQGYWGRKRVGDQLPTDYKP